MSKNNAKLVKKKGPKTHKNAKNVYKSLTTALKRWLSQGLGVFEHL
jgi:hypothetical protein